MMRATDQGHAVGAGEDGTIAPLPQQDMTGAMVRKAAWRNAAAVAVAGLGLLLVAFLVLKPAAQAGDNAAVVAPEAHHRAPDFTLVSTTGAWVTLSGLRGHPVLINFWFTNCPPCRTEMPELQRASQELRPAGAVILGVDAIGEDAGTIDAFAGQLGITYPLLLNSDQSVTRLYRIDVTPTSFVVDRRGIIRSVHVGPLTAREIRDGLRGL